MKRMIATITAISYSITNGIAVNVQEMPYTYYIKPTDIHYGGKNCEVGTLTVGSKIEHDAPLGKGVRRLANVIILSDGIKEVDTDGNLIKW